MFAGVGSSIFGTTTAQAYTAIDNWLAETMSTQAGGHPDIGIHASYDTRVINNGGGPPGEPCNACQDPRDVIVHFPTGFIGSPSQIPQCSLADFATEQCSTDTQVGVFMLYLPAFTEGKPYKGEPEPFGLFSPVYNLPPHPYEAAQLGFVAPIVKFGGQISLNARTESDYGLDAASFNIFHLIPVNGIDLYIWGTPASPIHDNARISESPTDDLHRNPDQPDRSASAPPFVGPACHAPVPSSAPLTPFLSNPTSCGEALLSNLDLFYYDNTHLSADSVWPATTGCDQLSFNPSLSSQPTTTQADTAAGLDVDLKVPQSLTRRPSPSEIRATTVTLPEGFSINPNAADGKTVCTEPRARSAPGKQRTCPEFSKIGTVELDSAALPGPIDGGDLPRRAAARRPLPDVPHRRRLRHPREARRRRPPRTRRPGRSSCPSRTCRRRRSRSSPCISSAPSGACSRRRSSAANTRSKANSFPGTRCCRTRSRPASSRSNSGPDGRPCPNGPRPFAPTVKAGAVDNTAGVHSPFDLKLTRDDGDQNLSGLTVTTPPGFAATLRGIPYCPEAAIAMLTTRATPGSPSGSPPRARPPARSACRPPASAPALIRSTSAARSTSRAPTRARRSASRRGPRGLRALRPRQRRGPGRGQRRSGRRPGHGGLRSAAADPRGYPAAAAIDHGQPRPAGLHPQPDELRAVLGRHHDPR